MAASEEEPSSPVGPSFGNMSAAHWSRARAGTNAEALEYYRQRSHAPGVAEGGGTRNFYCMECDGVIDDAAGHTRCPHCATELAGMSRRYFNWVEIAEPPKSDLRALLPYFMVILFGALLLVVLVWLWLA